MLRQGQSLLKCRAFNHLRLTFERHLEPIDFNQRCSLKHLPYFYLAEFNEVLHCTLQYDAIRSVNVCSSHSNCELNHFWLLQFPSQNNEAIVHKHYSQSLEQKAEENVLLIPLNTVRRANSQKYRLFLFQSCSVQKVVRSAISSII